MVFPTLSDNCYLIFNVLVDSSESEITSKQNTHTRARAHTHTHTHTHIARNNVSNILEFWSVMHNVYFLLVLNSRTFISNDQKCPMTSYCTYRSTCVHTLCIIMYNYYYNHIQHQIRQWNGVYNPQVYQQQVIYILLLFYSLFNILFNS